MDATSKDLQHLLGKRLQFPLLTVLVFLAVQVECKPSKIVVLPLPALRSQYFVLLQLGEELAMRGYEVKARGSIISFIEAGDDGEGEGEGENEIRGS